MPTCATKLNGVADEWAVHAELLRRINVNKSLILGHDEDADLKACNKDCSYNHLALRPCLERIAQNPQWQLFSVQRAEKEPHVSNHVKLNHKLHSQLVNLSTLWYVTRSSHHQHLGMIPIRIGMLC